MDNIPDEWQWKYETLLGTGGFGSVELWQNCFYQKARLAVKIPNNLNNMKPEIRQYWLKEVERMKEVDHPNIVSTVNDPPVALVKSILLRHSQSLDMFNPGKNMLFMEYCDGPNLAKLLSYPQNLNGLPESVVRNLCLQIGSAITYLHQKKIIHRDIKPANILSRVYVNSDNMMLGPTRTFIFKLADLCLARDLASENGLCQTFVGTHGYIAPEIFELERLRALGREITGQGYDKTVDFWSFGMIIREACCGRLPSHEVIPKEPNQLSKGFRQYLSAWLGSMTLANPAHRGKCFEENGSRCFMKKLIEILGRQFLELFTPWDVLPFKINSDMTVVNLMGMISTEISRVHLSPTNLLILSEEGRFYDSDDNVCVMQYFHPQDTKPCLYGIPFPWKALKGSRKIPEAFTNFLQNQNSGFDYVENRNVFQDVLHVLSTELSFLGLSQKSYLALKACCITQITLKPEGGEQFIKAKSFIEYEEAVQRVENKFQLMPSSLPDKKQEIESIFLQCQSYSNHCSSLLGPLHDVDSVMINLNKLYLACLKEFEKFKNDFSTYAMNDLKAIVVNFLPYYENALGTIDFNIRLIQSVLTNENDKIVFLKEALPKVDAIIADLKQERLEKQDHLLQLLTHYMGN